ncbi:MAG: hypothetical protein Q9196_001560 [Gyalolechia fulgens]
MHPPTLLTIATYAALIAANPVPEPEAAPQQLPAIPGLPTGLAASVTSAILNLIPSATAPAASLLSNVPSPGVGGALPPVPAVSSLPPVPGVGGALPPVPSVGGALPPVPAVSSLPPVPSVGGALPPVPSVGGALPPVPAVSSLPPVPGVGGALPPVPAVSPLPPAPGVGGTVPPAPGVGGAVPPTLGLPPAPGVPAVPVNDPTKLLGNITQAIQILEIVAIILGAQGGNSLNLGSLPVGVGLGSGNPLIRTLLSLVITLLSGATGVPVNPL